MVFTGSLRTRGTITRNMILWSLLAIFLLAHNMQHFAE